MLLFASFILHTSKNLTQLELTSPKKRGQCRTLHCQKGWIFSIGSTSCGVDPVFVATLKLDPYILSFNIAQKTKAWIKGKLADQISIHQNPKNDFMPHLSYGKPSQIFQLRREKKNQPGAKPSMDKTEVLPIPRRRLYGFAARFSVIFQAGVKPNF